MLKKFKITRIVDDGSVIEDIVLAFSKEQAKHAYIYAYPNIDTTKIICDEVC